MAAGVTLQDQITNFVLYLSERDLALSTTSVMLSQDSTQLSWYTRPGGERFLASRDHHSVANWMNWVRSGAFTVMLFDGALLQISFDLDGEEIVGHRLAYVPCPFLDAEDVLSELPIDELTEYYAGTIESIQLKTTIRFDYAPMDATDGHPATHLTINNAETRIACAGPLSFERFITFVFAHFYPELTDVSTYFNAVPTPGKYSRTINAHEESMIHLNWTT